MPFFGAVEAGSLCDNASNLGKEESHDNGVFDTYLFDLFLTLDESSTFSDLETVVDQELALVEDSNSA